LVSAAAKSFQRFTELLPLDGEGYFHLGLARMEASKLPDALRAFEKAISLVRAANRDVSPYLLPLLDTLHRMDRSAEASQRAKAFLKDPGPAGEALLEKIRQRVSK
jgi:tetratricopeptide (TPR) repeat protein